MDGKLNPNWKSTMADTTGNGMDMEDLEATAPYQAYGGLLDGELGYPPDEGVDPESSETLPP